MPTPTRRNAPPPPPLRRAPGLRPKADRQGPVYRLVQFGLIPLAAVLVVAWGMLGGGGWGSGSDADSGAAGERRGPAGLPATPAATPLTSASLPVASPRPAGRRATPAARAATPEARVTPETTGSTASPSPAPEVRDCVPPRDLPSASGPDALATIGTVDLRAAPGFDCRVLDELKPGAAVRIRGGLVRADGMGWLPVAVAGAEGWLPASLLGSADAVAAVETPGAQAPAPWRTPAPTATATATATPSEAVACAPPSPLPPAAGAESLVTTRPLNLRAGPGLGCDVLRVLAVGTEVRPRSGEVSADGWRWVLIEVDGARGWVTTAYLGPEG